MRGVIRAILDRGAGRRAVDGVVGHRQRRRGVPDGAVGGDGPRYPGRLPGRWPARRRPAGRLQRRTGRKQLGDGGQRDEHARRLGHLGGRTGKWCVEPLHQLGTGRQPAVGDVPGRRTAQLSGGQQGPGAQRPRHRRRRAGRHRRDDDGDVPPRPLSLRRVAVGVPRTGADRGGRRDHRGLGAVRRRRHPQHVGFATVGPVEVALAERRTFSCWRTTTPDCGCTARPWGGAAIPPR